MLEQRIDLPQGTVDLLILRTLVLGPQHGWGISERVQQTSSNLLRIQRPENHDLFQTGILAFRPVDPEHQPVHELRRECRTPWCTRRRQRRHGD